MSDRCQLDGAHWSLGDDAVGRAAENLPTEVHGQWGWRCGVALPPKQQYTAVSKQEQNGMDSRVPGVPVGLDRSCLWLEDDD